MGKKSTSNPISGIKRAQNPKSLSKTNQDILRKTNDPTQKTASLNRDSYNNSQEAELEFVSILHDNYNQKKKIRIENTLDKPITEHFSPETPQKPPATNTTTLNNPKQSPNNNSNTPSTTSSIQNSLINIEASLNTPSKQQEFNIQLSTPKTDYSLESEYNANGEELYPYSDTSEELNEAFMLDDEDEAQLLEIDSDENDKFEKLGQVMLNSIRKNRVARNTPGKIPNTLNGLFSTESGNSKGRNLVLEPPKFHLNKESNHVTFLDPNSSQEKPSESQTQKPELYKDQSFFKNFDPIIPEKSKNSVSNSPSINTPTASGNLKTKNISEMKSYPSVSKHKVIEDGSLLDWINSPSNLNENQDYSINWNSDPAIVFDANDAANILSENFDESSKFQSPEAITAAISSLNKDISDIKKMVSEIHQVLCLGAKPEISFNTKNEAPTKTKNSADDFPKEKIKTAIVKFEKNEIKEQSSKVEEKSLNKGGYLRKLKIENISLFLFSSFVKYPIYIALIFLVFSIIEFFAMGGFQNLY
ncbi:hypothetical protein BB558_005256 [Smittium angustum]|uniref:Uncharacterized protein n=1 Tax=Smittium angustum TaxID=133377 RepID=A0A2U1J145_SMIAN|nr:hypothetical protein BB558_005256 [Smittium angustum]